ncbi:MAG TPA: hypothetical protein DCY79_10335 [Planctomycetaceae bacterium]|nr:hypothetical protein [Planctomycetaceae bacterium]
MNRRIFVVLTVLAGVVLGALVISTDVDAERASALHRWLIQSGFDLALISGQLALLTVVFAVPCGVLFAACLTRTDMWGRGVATWFLVSLIFLPLYLQAAAWNAGFGRMGWYSLSTGPLVEPLLSGFEAAVWVHTMAAIPWVALIVGVGLRLTERNLEEQALLQWPQWRVFGFVTLPRVIPAVIVAALWAALSTTGEMVVTDIFQVRAYAEVLYSGFALLPDAGLVTARVLPGIVLVAMLSLGAFALAFLFAAQAPTQSLRAPLQFQLGRWKWPVTGGVWLGLLVIGGVPLGNLIYKAGVVATMHEGARIRHWSLEKFIEIMAATPGRFGEAFGWTLVIGVSAATLATVLALPLAWFARKRSWAAAPACLIAALLLAIPGPLVGLTVEWVLNRNQPAFLGWLYDTPFAPVLAVTCRVLPVAILILWFALRTVHRQTLEAAAMDGAGRLRTFFVVVIPQRWRSLTIAWVITFALAAGDLSWTSLVLPADVMTVPFQVFALIHSGVRYDEAAICLYVLLAVFTASAVVRSLARRWDA